MNWLQIIKLIFKFAPSAIEFIKKLLTIWREEEDWDEEEWLTTKQARGPEKYASPASLLVEVSKDFHNRVEERTGRNDHPMIDQFLKVVRAKKGAPWCAAFVCFCVEEVKNLEQMDDPKVIYSSSALNLVNRTIEKHKNEVNFKDLVPGDIWSMRRKDSHWKGHCGIVLTRPDRKGFFFSMEGNWRNKATIVKRNIYHDGKYYAMFRACRPFV